MLRKAERLPSPDRPGAALRPPRPTAPLNAGSLVDSTFAAFCASVRGMVNASFGLPPVT